MCVENRLSVEQSPKASTRTGGRTKSCNTSRALTHSPAVMRDCAPCYGHALKSLDVCFSLSLRVLVFCLTCLVSCAEQKKGLIIMSLASGGDFFFDEAERLLFFILEFDR